MRNVEDPAKEEEEVVEFTSRMSGPLPADPDPGRARDRRCAPSRFRAACVPALSRRAKRVVRRLEKCVTRMMSGR